MCLMNSVMNKAKRLRVKVGVLDTLWRYIRVMFHLSQTHMLVNINAMATNNRRREAFVDVVVARAAFMIR